MSEITGSSDLASGGATTSARPAGGGLLRSLAHRLAGDADVLPVEGHLPPFDGATRWLNSEPLTPQALRAGADYETRQWAKARVTRAGATQ